MQEVDFVEFREMMLNAESDSSEERRKSIANRRSLQEGVRPSVSLPDDSYIRQFLQKNMAKEERRPEAANREKHSSATVHESSSAPLEVQILLNLWYKEKVIFQTSHASCALVLRFVSLHEPASSDGHCFRQRLQQGRLFHEKEGGTGQ